MRWRHRVVNGHPTGSGHRSGHGSGFDGSVTLNPGGTLEVILTSNATTGYHWIVTSLNQGILQQTGDPVYKSNPNPQGLIGAGGKETFTFKAMAPGETSLKMNYQSPSNTPSDTNFNYSVKVS